MPWWEHKVLGLETLNGALLIQPQGRTNGITAALNAIRKRKKAARVLFEILCTNIARSHTLNILYSKSIWWLSLNFVKAFIDLVCLHFHLQWILSCPRAMSESSECFYVFSIDWVGLFNSIAAYPYLEVQRKSFENQWVEASKTKIIDCFQTPAGSGITNQNSSQGCLKLGFANPSTTSPNQEKW